MGLGGAEQNAVRDDTGASIVPVNGGLASIISKAFPDLVLFRDTIGIVNMRV